ncbi:MAG: hypothetical protein HY321_13785 [Armatimonadetes bacterium]|nr:hypothetical protein [Armatimonadota bacterium]
MRHRATPQFWSLYHRLPEEVRELSDRCYDVLRRNPRHPSLRMKKTGRFWTVRVGLHYRAVAVEHEGDLIWFWIGTHAEYDRLL